MEQIHGREDRAKQATVKIHPQGMSQSLESISDLLDGNHPIQIPTRPQPRMSKVATAIANGEYLADSEEEEDYDSEQEETPKGHLQMEEWECEAILEKNPFDKGARLRLSQIWI